MVLHDYYSALKEFYIITHLMNKMFWAQDEMLALCACSTEYKTIVWMLTLVSGDSAWNANARQHQCQSARAESWQREVGWGSCECPSQSKGGREWQAGVSSLTWVGQDEGKTLHLVIKPRWEDGGEEKGRDEKYVLDSDGFSGCVRPYLLVMLLPVKKWWQVDAML